MPDPAPDGKDGFGGLEPRRVAHQLNQPLAAIANYLRGSIRLLQQRGRPELDEVIDALGRAEQCTRRASDLVQQLRQAMEEDGAGRKSRNGP